MTWYRYVFFRQYHSLEEIDHDVSNYIFVDVIWKRPVLATKCCSILLWMSASENFSWYGNGSRISQLKPVVSRFANDLAS